MPTALDLDRLHDCKNQLNSALEQNTQSIMFRSKKKWLHLGEKPTKYFLNLEKCRYNAHMCNALLDDNNKLIKDANIILQIQEHFYSHLYSNDNAVHFPDIGEAKISLSNNEKNSLDSEITETEFATAVREMSNGKTGWVTNWVLKAILERNKIHLC